MNTAEARGQKKVYGNWTYKPSTQVLVHKHPTYEVDSEDMTTSAQCLDWIFQVHTKDWVSDSDIVDLLKAIQELVNPQANLCSYGIERSGKNVNV